MDHARLEILLDRDRRQLAWAHFLDVSKGILATT
jgi:hypothetical protein